MAKAIGQQTVTTTTSYSKNPNIKVLHRGDFLEVSNEVHTFLWFLYSCKYHFGSLQNEIHKKKSELRQII